ncbi:MAG TPA: hypothetical protein PKN80_02350 [bacterium]|uniref:Uncharacterized protein n=1 Tax=candidate division TA06 bacterium ADurb.Bin417 TaxID=1852828 RepID=A0A1V5M5U0_UNCT6|nr:MAG: hypothetical protein BWY73_01640 [candidate division TA06 bacterium ADurb.Bin417]HNQ34885.1 hypothetical protein [bacterium]HNS48488.1 hypothetical protein [bacterium]
MDWYARKFERFMQLPRPLMILHVSSKTLFGLGAGILWGMAAGTAAKTLGWSIIILSLLVAIPSSCRILRR